MSPTKSTVLTSREYDWPRFWIPLGGSIDLSEGGYLVDPTGEIAKYGGRNFSTLAELTKFRVLALLGEPGMGKSAALRSEARRLEGNDNFTSIFVDLRAYSSEALLYKKVFESPEFLAWKDGKSNLVLLLDSLDEALLRVDIWCVRLSWIATHPNHSARRPLASGDHQGSGQPRILVVPG